MRHDWPVKMPLLICQSGCRHISTNSLRQLEAQNKDVVAALQALLTGVRCQCDAGYCLSG